MFGICIFYFSLIYRPHKFLDRMLTDIVSDMPADVLKIDMKFLSSTEDEVRAKKIFRNIIRL